MSTVHPASSHRNWFPIAESIPTSSALSFEEKESIQQLFAWERRCMGYDIGKAVALILAFIQNPKATSLDLTGVCRSFSHIPPLFGDPFASRLKVLHLSGNSWRWDGEELKLLSALEELYLDNCELSHVYRSIEHLSQLRILHLQNNQLKNFAPEFGFQRLVHLEELDLSHNKIETLPSRLSQIPYLKTLGLGYNQLSYLPSEIEQFGFLQHLDINDNPPELYHCISKIIPLRPRYLRQIRYLDLSHSVDPFHLYRNNPKNQNSEEKQAEPKTDSSSCFGIFPALLQLPSSCTICLNLRLISAPIRDALARVCFAEGYEGPQIEGLLRYTRIAFSDLSLQDALNALQATIDAERWLKSVLYWSSDVKRNQVYEQLIEFIADPTRTSLDFTHQLKGIDSLPPIFQEPFSRLKSLRLSDNYWRWDTDCLQYLTALEELYFDNCGLRQMSGSIEKLSQLRILDLRHNQLKSLDVQEESKMREFQFQHLVHLEELDVSYNFLWKISATINELTSLKVLLLSRNLLSQVPIDPARLSRLQRLDLSNNPPDLYRRLPSKSQSWAKDLKQLNYLDVSHLKCAFSLIMGLLDLPAACTVRLNLRDIPPSICNALAQVCFAKDYKGPKFTDLTQYIEPFSSTPSLSEAYDALQATIDREQAARRIDHIT